MNTRFLAVLLFAALIGMGCNNQDRSGEDGGDKADNLIPAPLKLNPNVINKFPHDTTAFTEGFSFYNGQLYESTGAPDEPSNSGTWIASVDLKTGKVDKKIDQGMTYFGEGIAFFDDKLYQLTYRSKIGFVYDAKTFKKLREFKYGSEGWGLTHDGRNLIMSTGSSNIYYLSPDSLNFIKMLAVQDNNGYVPDINELEYIDGFIYANQWQTAYILKIDPNTGYVVGKMDFTPQLNEAKAQFSGSQEMNGIAYDSTSRKTYVTGKKWPFVYEIKW